VTETSTQTETAPAATDCPRCGAEAKPGQEYCLECGERLPGADGRVVPRMAAAWRRTLPWYPGDWIWGALLCLVVAAAGLVFAILYSQHDNASGTAITATSPTLSAPGASVPPATDTGGVPPTPTATATVDTTQANLVPPGKPTTTTAPPAAKPGLLSAWPARNGYTIVLESLPAAGSGRTLALQKARQALKAGLPQVGVLDSGGYSSLHPGYYVVFSGVYSSLAEAQSAAGAAHAKGFRAAYARQITT
jgi:hypothetical protein